MRPSPPVVNPIFPSLPRPSQRQVEIREARISMFQVREARISMFQVVVEEEEEFWVHHHFDVYMYLWVDS